MAVPGSFPIFPRRPSVTLRPDRGTGLVSFFNFPLLDRSSEKWRAIPRVFDRAVRVVCRSDGPVAILLFCLIVTKAGEKPCPTKI
jgi:hypothetical protein